MFIHPLLTTFDTKNEETEQKFKFRLNNYQNLFSNLRMIIDWRHEFNVSTIYREEFKIHLEKLNIVTDLILKSKYERAPDFPHSDKERKQRTLTKPMTQIQRILD